MAAGFVALSVGVGPQLPNRSHGHSAQNDPRRAGEHPGVTQLAEALCRGQITAALAPIPDLVLLRKLFPDLEYRMAFGEVRSAAWAVRKQDQRLKAALDAYLSGARRGGTWSRVVVKHWGSEALKVLGRVRGELAQGP